MQVTRLEIFGFKSFMDRLVLPLNKGITGIVGPNGCGKSNIVDAIRWILGETRAKSLRGGVLEDVIFNGTDKLRPLGLAEVSISVKSDGADFFEELVTPALEAEVLADEVEEVLEQSDQVNAAVEAVEKGEHPQPLHIESSAEPPADLNISSQLSGLAASLPTQNLIQKYSWLKSASEVQVTRRLYRSGESEFFLNRVPCRLKDIKDFFRAVGLSAKGFTIVAQGEVSQIITAKPEQRRMLLEEAAGVQGFREKINSAQSRLEESRQNLARLQDIIAEVERQVGVLRRQAARARNREELKAEIKQLDCALFRHSLYENDAALSQVVEQCARSSENEAAHDAAYQKSRQEEQNCRGRIMEAEVEGDSLRSEMDSVREDLNSRLSERSARTERISELKAVLHSAKTNHESITTESTELVGRIAALQAELGELKTEESRLAQALQTIDKSTNAELETKLQAVAKLKEEVRAVQREVQDSREVYVSLSAQLKSREEQLATLTPKNTRGIDGLSGDLRTFSEQINVPAEYARAIEAVLQEQSSFLIADDCYQAMSLYRQSQKTTPLGIFKSTPVVSDSGSTDKLPSIISVIGYSPEVESLVRAVFADCLIASSSEVAREFFVSSPDSKAKVVTKDGELYTAYSASFGSASEGAVIIREKISDLQREIRRQESALADKTATLDGQIAALSSAEKELEGVQNDAQSRNLEARNVGNQLGAVKGRIHSEERLLAQLQSSLTMLADRGRQLLAQSQSCEEELSQSGGSENSESALEEEKLKARLSGLNETYSAAEKVRQGLRSELQKLADKSELDRQKLDVARQHTSELALDRQRLEMERKALNEKIDLEYGPEVAAEIGQSLEPSCTLGVDVFAANQEEVHKLKARLVREGEIDPESIQRYEQENSRLQELEMQRADLNKAIKALEETIAKLVATSERRFLETFTRVADNFSKMIPKLFGGGKGELALSDPLKPLDSGLDITARPPGKKLKSIELMSGGEKALCATALIVSMFLVRPSPICVLDEVDAPLDEANLSRFLGIVREMSDRVQFVMITHNKQSMAVADNLVGVTMEQPGSTKVLSVSLQDADAYVQPSNPEPATA